MSNNRMNYRMHCNLIFEDPNLLAKFEIKNIRDLCMEHPPPHLKFNQKINYLTIHLLFN